MYYVVCNRCGCYLDPCEKCDCNDYKGEKFLLLEGYKIKINIKELTNAR
jgi:hypothetical protein